LRRGKAHRRYARFWHRAAVAALTTLDFNRLRDL
jgi:hypothetical protein